MVSRLERGLGDSASLQTWALAAAAVGQQLVSFLEDAPGQAHRAISSTSGVKSW